jgi:glycine cleavage system H protein
MELPESFLYTRDHEWIAAKQGETTVGVTGFAVEQLGDIVHIELPEVGSQYAAGDSFGTIESTKTVSDLYMPVDGKVTAVNQTVLAKPESLQSDPYHEGWLVKVEITKAPNSDQLLSASAYKAVVSS